MVLSLTGRCHTNPKVLDPAMVFGGVDRLYPQTKTDKVIVKPLRAGPPVHVIRFLIDDLWARAHAEKTRVMAASSNVLISLEAASAPQEWSSPALASNRRRPKANENIIRPRLPVFPSADD